MECVRSACPDPDFIEKNGAWLLTVMAGLTACFGGVLTYMLKSRCSMISCLGVTCTREVIDLNQDVQITAAS